MGFRCGDAMHFVLNVYFVFLLSSDIFPMGFWFWVDCMAGTERGEQGGTGGVWCDGTMYAIDAR